MPYDLDQRPAGVDLHGRHRAQQRLDFGGISRDPLAFSGGFPERIGPPARDAVECYLHRRGE
jgi:hypothetical protein